MCTRPVLVARMGLSSVHAATCLPDNMGPCSSGLDRAPAQSEVQPNYDVPEVFSWIGVRRGIHGYASVDHH